MNETIAVLDLGRRGYAPVLELQRELCRRRVAGELTEDLLLLVEHDPVVTLGRGTRDSSLPLSRALLQDRGLDVFEVERGGDVTLHAPGQLVGYPIIGLGGFRQDLHWYLRQLEETLIRGLSALGVGADRNPGKTGVWSSGRKIASIGIHVKQWVTLHGFALNVTTDLSLFDLIVPCGIHGVTMTSVARELSVLPSDHLWSSTRAVVVRHFGEVFGREMVARPQGEVISGEPAATREG
jgi:lipoate-protein ligase B